MRNCRLFLVIAFIWPSLLTNALLIPNIEYETSGNILPPKIEEQTYSLTLANDEPSESVPPISITGVAIDPKTGKPVKEGVKVYAYIGVYPKGGGNVSSAGPFETTTEVDGSYEIIINIPEEFYDTSRWEKYLLGIGIREKKNSGGYQTIDYINIEISAEEFQKIINGDVLSREGVRIKIAGTSSNPSQVNPAEVDPEVEQMLDNLEKAKNAEKKFNLLCEIKDRLIEEEIPVATKNRTGRVVTNVFTTSHAVRVRSMALSVLSFIARDNEVDPGVKSYMSQPVLSDGFARFRANGTIRAKSYEVLLDIIRDSRVDITCKEAMINDLIKVYTNDPDQSFKDRSATLLRAIAEMPGISEGNRTRIEQVLGGVPDPGPTVPETPPAVPSPTSPSNTEIEAKLARLISPSTPDVEKIVIIGELKDFINTNNPPDLALNAKILNTIIDKIISNRNESLAVRKEAAWFIENVVSNRITYGKRVVEDSVIVNAVSPLVNAFVERSPFASIWYNDYRYVLGSALVKIVESPVFNLNPNQLTNIIRKVSELALRQNFPYEFEIIKRYAFQILTEAVKKPNANRGEIYNLADLMIDKLCNSLGYYPAYKMEMLDLLDSIAEIPDIGRDFIYGKINNQLSGITKSIWNEYNILVVGAYEALNQGAILAVYKTLSALPKYLIPSNLKAIFDDPWANNSGEIAHHFDEYITVCSKMSCELSVLFHEFGHAMQDEGLRNKDKVKVGGEELIIDWKQWQYLTEASGKDPDNYVGGYKFYFPQQFWGDSRSTNEDWAYTFQAYISNYSNDVDGIYWDAKALALREKPILLRKLEFIAKLFMHKVKNELRTYTFYIYEAISNDGVRIERVVRREHPLIKQKIGNEWFWLPDITRVREEVEF